MIKKRISVEHLTRPIIIQHDNKSQSPIKLIRQLPRQASFNTQSAKKDLFQECVALVNDIKFKYQSNKGRKFFHVRSCSMPCDRVYIINQLIDSLLPQSPRKQQRSLDSEIQCVMRQLMEEKQQKQKAILQHDSLAKKYNQSIQQLVIESYYLEISHRTIQKLINYMNLTRHNFFQHLPLIKKTISEANYIAIDFELTGVLASPLLRNSLLDSFQMRYWKAKENVRRFLPIQMGICTFSQSNDVIVAHPYNFYIFPFGIDGYLDKQFQFSSATVQFLANNNYDFNKTFYEGIFYLSHQDEKILQETKRIQDLKNDLRFVDKTVSFEMLAYLNQHRIQAEQFFKVSNETELIIPIQGIKVKVYRHFLDSIKKEFGKDHQFHVKFDSDIFFKRQYLSIVKGPEPPEMKKNISDVSDFYGVRDLIDQISQQKTPVLFHNGLVDIMHIYDKFYQSLPDTRIEFIKQVSEIFPNVFDTKFMINQSYSLFSKVTQFSELKNSFMTLQDLEPKIVFGDECQEYNNPDGQFEHEAGFDSYMTGCVFYKAKKYMNLTEEKMLLYKNKIPQSSIKVPFDLNDKTGQDRFHGNSIAIFHIEILEKNLVPDSLIKDHFKSIYQTDVDLFLSYGQNYEYFMLFQNQEASQQFRQILKNGAAIIKIGEHEFVVSEYENYVQKLQRRAKDELTIKEMNTILE